MNKIVYMDAAASWLKPESVIESQTRFLRESYANAGRGICPRAGAVDDLIARARADVAGFINCKSENIVWTHGTTGAMNRIVNIVKNTLTNKCPTVVVSDLDHHSARLPWEMCAKNGNCKIRVMPLDDKLNIDINRIPLGDVFVVTAMSNVLGMPQDIESIAHEIRTKNPNAVIIVDAAQFIVHKKIDVSKINCDFLCFSGHKIGADTGVGVMYVKNPDVWSVDEFGGGMVNRVLDNGDIVFNRAPERFEAGTLPITQIIGFPYAIKYASDWDGGEKIKNYIYDELSKIDKIKIITSRDACMISGTIDGMHVLDFGAMIGMRGVCVRVGNMCASWIHKKLNIDGSVRISIGPWNTMDDAEYVVDVIKDLVK